MTWQQFLEDVFLGDAETIETMQLLVGYASTGDKTAGIIVVCHGDGRNGRTTFFSALSLALGGALAFGFAQSLRPHAMRPNPEMLAFKAARLAVFSEPFFHGVTKEAETLKRFSSRDAIVARAPYIREPESFQNLATPFICCGGLPRSVRKDPSFIDRCVIVRFPASFADHPIGLLRKALPSGNILGDLRENVPAITTWIEEGAQIYREQGLNIPARFRSSDAFAAGGAA